MSIFDQKLGHDDSRNDIGLYTDHSFFFICNFSGRGNALNVKESTSSFFILFKTIKNGFKLSAMAEWL